LADASLFGYGLSVASDGSNYHASFYDAVLRTLGYLRLDSAYTVIGDITTYMGPSNWLMEKVGDGYAVKVSNALDAGWNTDVAVRPSGSPHIVFTALLSNSEKSLSQAVTLATPSTVAYAVISSGAWVVDPVSTSASNVRDLSLEVDSSNNPHIFWAVAGEGVYYAKRSGTSWDISRVVNANLSKGSLESSLTTLAGGVEVLGMIASFVEGSSSSVSFLGKRLTDASFSSYNVISESTTSPREVGVAFSGSKASFAYTSGGGIGPIKYGEAEYFTSGATWSVTGTSGTVSDGGASSAERRDVSVVLDGSNFYVLYKYKDGSSYYYRLGPITGTPVYVETSAGRFEASSPVQVNATRTEALLKSNLIFVKNKESGQIRVLSISEAPTGPRVTLSYDTLNLGDVLLGESKQGAVSITLKGEGLASPATVSWSASGDGWTIDKIEVNGVETTSQSLTVPVTGSVVLKLTLTFEPQAAGVSNLLLNFTPPSGVSMYPSANITAATARGIEVTGPTVLISCDPIDLGEVRIGESESATVTITLNGRELTEDVELSWEASGEGWSVEGGSSGEVTVPASGEATLTLKVTFEPKRVGPSVLTVKFTAPEGVEVYSSDIVVATAEGVKAGGGGGCSASQAGSLGLALLALAPLFLALKRR